jgi:hypothetical protein
MFFPVMPDRRQAVSIFDRPISKAFQRRRLQRNKSVVVLRDFCSSKKEIEKS